MVCGPHDLSGTSDNNLMRGNDGRDSQHWLVAPAVCAAAGLIAGLVLGLDPVGSQAASIAWTGVLGAFAGIVLPRAPLWLVVLAAFSTLGFVETEVGGGFALVALGTAVWIVDQNGWSSTIAEGTTLIGHGALVEAVASTSLLLSTLTLQDHGRPFASAAFAAGVWLVLALAAFIRQPKHARLAILTTSITTFLAVSAVSVAAAADLREAHDAATGAQSELRSGLRSIQQGEFGALDSSIERAVSQVNTAQSALSSPFVEVFRHTPVAGPNLRAVQEVLKPASDLAESVQAASLATGGLDDLLTAEGLAIDEIRELSENADTVLQNALALREVVVRQQTQDAAWIVPPVDHQLAEIVARTTPLEGVAEVSVREVTEQLLGSNEPRSYLVLLGNTAEARELGGFAGAATLISVDQGAVSLVRSNRPRDFDRSSAAALSDVVPQRFLDHRPWIHPQNYTAMVDFPTLARAVSDLYPTMGGTEVDGIAYIDPMTVAALVGLVGEVHLEEADVTVSPEQVVQLISVEQYEQYDERSQRENFLSELIAATFDAVFTREADFDLAQASELLAAIEQDRFLFAPSDAAEFQLMETLGVVGGLPDRAGNDYLAVSTLNAGPNKLDTYLHRTVSYQAQLNPTTGGLEAVVEVTLRNEAPAGLPSYAASNGHDLARGSNRSIVVVHTPHDLTDWSGGDEPAMQRSWREFDLQRHEQVVVIPRGETRTVTFTLAGSVPEGAEYQLDLGHQPLLNTDSVALHIEPTSGWNETLSQEFELTTDRRFTASWTNEESDS